MFSHNFFSIAFSEFVSAVKRLTATKTGTPNLRTFSTFAEARQATVFNTQEDNMSETSRYPFIGR